MARALHVHTPYNAFKRGFFEERNRLLFSLGLKGRQGSITLLCLKDLSLCKYTDNTYLCCRAGAELHVVESIDNLNATEETKAFAQRERQKGMIIVEVDGFVCAVEPKDVMDCCV